MNRKTENNKSVFTACRLVLSILMAFGSGLPLFGQKDSLLARFDTELDALTYQANACFNSFLREGIDNFQRGNYDLAVRQFRAAGVCIENNRSESFQADRLMEIALQMRDISTIDSLSLELSLLREAQQNSKEWEELLAYLDELAGRRDGDQRFPEKAAHSMAMEDIRQLIRIRSGGLASGSKGRTNATNDAVARSRDLATRANLEILRRNPELAMALALEARRTLDTFNLKDTLVEQTFGNAVFARYAQPIEGHADAVIDAAFSPDGRHLITRGRDNAVRIWQADSLDGPVAIINNGSFIHAAEFSREGRLVTASADSSASLWNLRGEELSPPLRGHRDQVLSASFSPDGKYILTGSRDSTVRLWDGQGNLIRSFPFDNPVYEAAFSLDGSKVLAVAPAKVEVWDTLGNELGTKNMDDVLFYTAHFSPRNDNLLLTSSSDAVAQFWKIPGNPSELLPAKPLAEGELIPFVQFSTGDYLLTASLGKVTLYQGEEFRFAAPCRSRPTQADFAGPAGGEALLFATQDGAVELWDIQGEARILNVNLAPAYASALALAPDGRKFLLALNDNTILLCPNPETIYEEMK